MNKKIVMSLFAIAFAITSFKAQKHEIGIRLGTSNLVGDIGKTGYILHTPADNISQFGLPTYSGLMYKLNFNPYQSIRFDVGYSHVQFNDLEAKEQYRVRRGMWGTNNVVDADIIFEYNLFPTNEEQKSMVSPYVFGGVGAMMFDANQVSVHHDFKRDQDGVALAPESELDFESKVTYEHRNKFTFSVPFGVGLKYKFNYNWTIFGEAMFRPTFSDQLDYSTLKSDDLKASYNTDILDPATGNSLLQNDIYYTVSKEREAQLINDRTVGNTNSKDWMNTFSIGITYSFGKEPCFCNK